MKATDPIELDLPFRVIFVAGAPRSGTSLLYALLCTSAETNPPMPEVGPLLPFFNSWLIGLNGGPDFTERYFPDISTFRDLVCESMRLFLTAYWRAMGSPPVAVFKFPQLAQIYGPLAALLPGCSFLSVVRSPVAVVQSNAAVARRRYPNFEVSKEYVRRTAAALTASYDYETGGNILIVRYEDVVSQAATADLARFCGLPDIDASKLTTIGWRRSDPQNPWHSPQYGGPLQDVQFHLEPSLLPFVELIDQLTGSLRSRFGYPSAGN